jgi:hypothetical protein
VVAAGGRIQLVIVGIGGATEPSGPEGDRIDDLVLRFPNGEAVVAVEDGLDPPLRSSVGWYGPIGTTAGDD